MLQNMKLLWWKCATYLSTSPFFPTMFITHIWLARYHRMMEKTGSLPWWAPSLVREQVITGHCEEDNSYWKQGRWLGGVHSGYAAGAKLYRGGEGLWLPRSMRTRTRSYSHQARSQESVIWDKYLNTTHLCLCLQLGRTMPAAQYGWKPLDV